MKPSLAELGTDLLATGGRQRRIAPSHHLARLSRPLEEFLTRSGVVPRRVI